MSRISAVHRFAGPPALALILSFGIGFGGVQAKTGPNPPGTMPTNPATPNPTQMRGSCLLGFSGEQSRRNPHAFTCRSTNQIGTLDGNYATAGLWGCAAGNQVVNSSPKAENDRFVYRCRAVGSTTYVPFGCTYPNYQYQQVSTGLHAIYRCTSVVPKCKAPYVRDPGQPPKFNTTNRRFEYGCKHSQY